ncbi:hypothetical protein [Paraburkholderia guartelaensis]|nr:hypothetical protein [Paraburkholderia guartelaensis]
MTALRLRFGLRDVKSELRLAWLVAWGVDPIVIETGNPDREVKNEVRDEN